MVVFSEFLLLKGIKTFLGGVAMRKLKRKAKSILVIGDKTSKNELVIIVIL